MRLGENLILGASFLRFPFRSPAIMSKRRTTAAKTKQLQPSVTDSSRSLTRDLERYLADKYEYVIGMDEAGRGPLAGPVVAAACYLPAESGVLSGIADSKLLSEADREKAFEEIESNPLVQYAYCIVSHTEIDEVNILQASMLAMSRSTSALLAGMGLLPSSAMHSTATLKPLMTSTQTTDSKTKRHDKFPSKEMFLGMVDGNRIPTDLPIEGKFVIQGDRKVYSIAAASIIAKVIRDRIMVDLDRQYPLYMFAQHKGYPTFAHRSLLMEHGPCEVHRRTYGPVKNAILSLQKRNLAPDSSLSKEILVKKRKRSMDDILLKEQSKQVKKKKSPNKSIRDEQISNSQLYNLRRSPRLSGGREREN